MNFHYFAMRNLDVGEVLLSAGEKTYNAEDPRFPQNDPPSRMESAVINPGDPFLSGQGGPVQLSAAYYQFQIGPAAKEVTVSLANMSPADQLDGEALVHLAGGSSWAKRPFVDGQLKYCRDDPGDDIDKLYVVVSNHSTQVPVQGFLEASAKESCEQQVRVIGDYSWNQTLTEKLPDLTIVTTANGTAHIDAIRDETTGHWDFQGDSTYSLDYSISNCSPGAHFSGTIESTIEPREATPGIAIGAISGAPREDIEIDLRIGETWTPSCSFGGPAGPEPQDTLYGLPGCARIGTVTALFDGKESYVIHCEGGPPDLSGGTVAGTITGTLTGMNSSSPAP